MNSVLRIIYDELRIGYHWAVFQTKSVNYTVHLTGDEILFVGSLLVQCHSSWSNEQILAPFDSTI
jgi:hypothetical protein